MGKESKTRRSRREMLGQERAIEASTLASFTATTGDGAWSPSDTTISFSVSQYETFFRIACASYRKLKEVQEREVDWPTGSAEGPNPESLRRSSYEQRQRFAAVAVIFSALTLESFINHYGSQLDTDLFNALDRSNVS